MVVYLHSKGSFHDSTGQKQLREYLTKGALSEECLTLPNQCNVCSTRISPHPHLHVPGIMWASRCDYVSRLVDPLAFEDAMTSYMGRAKTLDQKCKQGSPAVSTGTDFLMSTGCCRTLGHIHVISTATTHIFGALLGVALAGKTSTRA